MTSPLPRSGVIAALDGTVSGALDGSDAQNPLRPNRYYENYEITGLTGIPAGKAVEVSLEAGFDAFLEIIDASSGAIVAQDDEGGVGSDARLSFLPAAGITYFARASTYFEQETGTFTLRTRLIDPADLEVTGATGPSVASIGTRIDLSWTVKNNGPGEARSFPMDGIYLSTNNVFDPSDTLVDEYWPQEYSYDGTFSPIAPGDTRTRNLRFTAPSVSSAGLYYFLVRTDHLSSQAETNEDNNTRAIPVNFSLNGPDLQITAASAPAASSIGGQLNLSWTVRNTGSAGTSSEYPWDDIIYLSTDPALDSNDIIIGSEFSPGYSSSPEYPPLLPGVSYTSTTTVSTPNVSTSGNYYLIFSTDGDFVQGETNEQNNTLALPISIDANGPDLQPTAASAPATASIGSSLNVSWTIKNNGTRTAESDWWDGIYLSTDANYNYSDRYISSFSAADLSPLAPGASYTLNKTINTPIVATAGSYYLIFRADDTSRQGETNETNNTIAVPISIDLNGPDLQPITISAPTTASIGSSVSVSWRVRNNGTRTAESDWWDAIYFSTNATYDSDDQYIQALSAADLSPLAANASYLREASFSIPNVTTSGTHYLIIRTDTYSNQGETNENNNDIAVPINIDLNGPDLQIIAASAPATAIIDEIINLSWTLKNSGNLAVERSWWDGVYLSSDNLYDINDTFFGGLNSGPFIPLAAGASYNVSGVGFGVPRVSPGQYYLLFRADYTAQQGETNEANNTFAIPLTVTSASAALPVISLTVTPPIPGVTEDGSSNLIYTFSRSGPLTNSLTVNYTVSGTALQGTDYSGISPWTADNPIKIITFAAGSSTATVSVDPITDGTAEPDETVILTLETGTGYTIGSPSAVTGVILNDDLPLVSLSVTPSLGVSEDGSDNLIYTFSRTGPTTTSLMVAFNIGGSASLVAGDYSQQGALSFTGTSGFINFAAGASTATITIDPTTDPDSEPDETLILSLAAGVSYTIGTPNAATGTIRNDDASIEAKGNTTLLRRGDGQVFAQVGNTRTPITSPWGVSIGSPTTTWQILAAETIAGVNQLLWRNNTGNFLHTWTLDSNWNWTASSGTFALNDIPGWELESAFQVDANDDGSIGTPFTTLETRGNITLLSRTDGRAYARSGPGPLYQISTPWGVNVGSDTSAWQILAADTITGVNHVLLRNNTGNFLHTWTLDSNWNWTSSGGTFALNDTPGWNLEATFQVDADRDGTIGNPYTTIEAQGNTTLLTRSGGQAYAQVGTGPRLQISTPWGVNVGSDTSTWQILAADTIAGVNQVLLRNNTGNFLHTWTLDSNWNWTSSGGTFPLNDASGWSLESSFQVDANNDGAIGAPFSTIENRGSTTLLRRPGDDQAFVQVGTGPRTQVTTPWGAAIGTNTSTWQIIAADTIAGVNQVLLRNNIGNFLHTWTLNSNWNWTSSGGTFSLNDASGWSLESTFQVDANNDGIIGTPFPTIENRGSTTLLRRPSDDQAFVQVGTGPRTQVTTPWGAPIGTNTSTWQILAADTFAGVNQVLLRNNPGNFLHTWTLDSNWSWTASNGTISPTSPQGLALLNQFGLG